MVPRFYPLTSNISRPIEHVKVVNLYCGFTVFHNGQTQQTDYCVVVKLQAVVVRLHICKYNRNYVVYNQLFYVRMLCSRFLNPEL